MTATTAHLPAASGDFIVRQILIIPIRLIVIPTSILALVLHESFGTTAYRRFASLGDITYSSYLIHFPMQLFIAVFVVCDRKRSTYFSIRTSNDDLLCRASRPVFVVLSTVRNADAEVREVDVVAYSASRFRRCLTIDRTLDPL